LPNGEQHWFHTVKVPLIREDDSIAVLGLSFDVTEQKRAQEALHESEERYLIRIKAENTLFRTLIDNLPLNVYIKDRNSRKTFANRAEYEYVGLKSEADLLGKDDYELYSPESARHSIDEDQYVFATGKPILAKEAVITTKDGNQHFYLSYKMPLKDDDGKIIGLLGGSYDITDRKQIELLVQQKNAELLIAKEKAQESDRLKSAFLANMSHEIRTPMNGILGFAELLKKPNIEIEKQRQFLDLIEKSGRRMLSIINNIIDISKIEAGGINVLLSDTDVHEQMEFIHAFFKQEAEKKGIHLLKKNPQPFKKMIVITDREKVYAILTNLVKNAIKFTQEGFIEFGYQAHPTRPETAQVSESGELEFFVKDTGIGIPSDQLETIFERFRRVDEMLHRDYEGSGLGLAISKSYVEMLGGKIWVKSEHGKGSAFYFTIPYEKIKKIEKKTKLISSSEKKMRQLKIVIAEDDDTSAELLKSGFKLEGLAREIIIVTSGIEVIKVCRTNPDIDLILMDIQLPSMDGHQATRHIRQFNKQVVVIAQSAFALSDSRQKAIAAGCTDYISKPINMNELLTLIRKYI
jgi:hypothetical protein